MRLLSRALAGALWIALAAPGAAAQSAPPTIEQFMSPASPLYHASAKKADRVVWVTYDRGMRNLYTAAAPDFRPVRLTRFLDDDGTDLSDPAVSDDGAIAVFVRGHAPNRAGWVANPFHAPEGAERAIWAVRTSGGAPWRLAEGGAPVLSPDGRAVLYVKDGQIYRARIGGANADSMDRGQKPFIRQWGRQSNPRWSPDGSRIAFVSNRGDHSFIGIYDTKTRVVNFVAPSVDFDESPTWSEDGKRLAFVRCPGAPFGAQGQEGTGGIGNPPGPAAAATAAGRVTGCGGGGGGNAAARAQQDSAQAALAQRARQSPGLYRGMLTGGSTRSIMVVDLAACPLTAAERDKHADGGCGAREVWHNEPADRVFASINTIRWAGDAVIFPVAVPSDEWDRWYSVSMVAMAPRPVLLTTTDGLIEDATSVALSPDGRTLYYCTNAGDIERRHIWAVPTLGGEAPRRVSTGDGIETWPQPLGSGKQVAVIAMGAALPASIGLVPASGGAPRIIYPTLGKDFPVAAHVTPEIVKTRASDGLEIPNQLFLPKDLRPGERRPAIVFVHGGPRRQMMPGYHYMQFYHWSYAVNQWLASKGYVVLSINYRSGIGYGNSFRNAEKTNLRGNSEYLDVVAGGKYLQSRSDVDPARVGIWGLSYGGLLVSQALARNSDLFVAGADLAGVHLYGNSLDSAQLSYKSSAISAIDTWKSPVFLVHGDDDRNVNFAQTVGLVQLLRARDIYHELIVVPDDVHESLLHSRWIDTWERMGTFLDRFVKNKAGAAVGAGR